MTAAPVSNRQGGEDRWSVELRITGLAKKNFTRGHWRKSAQWVALNREHAALVARERELLWELGFMYPAGKEWMSRKRYATRPRAVHPRTLYAKPHPKP